MGEFVKVAKAGDIAPGESKLVDAAGKKIALFNVDGTFYAIDETCTHRGGPLSEGLLMVIERISVLVFSRDFEDDAERFVLPSGH